MARTRGGGGFSGTRSRSGGPYVEALGYRDFFGLSPSANPGSSVDDPSIGTPSAFNQVTDSDTIDLSWPVTMASSGDAATSLTATLYDSTDLVNPLAGPQVINTGIGLGDALTVTFTGVDGVNQGVPRAFELTLEVA